ncbi:MAG: O-antigen ligase family protein [Patescibacteria group bacterium]
MAYRVDGTFSHPATLAFYLISTLPIIYALLSNKINKSKKIPLAVLLLLNLFIALITLTRGAWIGLLAMSLVFGLFKSRKFLVAITALIFLAYLFTPAINERVNDVFNPKYNSSLITRLKIIETTLPAFTNAPVLGYGLGSFKNINLKYNDEAKTYESLQAHNDYLRLLIELGIIGLAIYISIFISLFILIYKLYKTDSKYIRNYLFSLIILWLGILAISLGDNILRTMPLQFLIWSYTGAVIAYANLKEVS